MEEGVEEEEVVMAEVSTRDWCALIRTLSTKLLIWHHLT